MNGRYRIVAARLHNYTRYAKPCIDVVRAAP
jgi:hypothetical protein